MDRRMVKKKGRARERQRKGQSQGEGAHVETWKSRVVPGASEHPPPWGLSPGHTHRHRHRHTHTHTTSCGDSPSVFSILVHFLFSDYLLLEDTVLRTLCLILRNLQDSPERQIGAEAERS